MMSELIFDLNNMDTLSLESVVYMASIDITCSYIENAVFSALLGSGGLSRTSTKASLYSTLSFKV